MSVYIGLMSGTSCDGVDGVAIASDSNELLAKTFKPYPKPLRARCLDLIFNQSLSLHEINALAQDLAIVYAEVVSEIKAQLADKVEIKAIGCHGQTVTHNTQTFPPYTMQLGNPTFLSCLTALPVVSDFRQQDIALGGQGAPLAPLFHRELFELNPEIAVLNIGGIANLSFVDTKEQLYGFDTGPGNCLMDGWISRHQDKQYDDEGQWAQGGVVSTKLLALLLENPYFAKPAPKSADREDFSLRHLDELIMRLGKPIEAQDVQATLLAFSADTIINAVRKFIPDCQTLICLGGGARNKALMKRLAEKYKLEFHLNGDYIEAMLMAWLAKERIEERRFDMSSITGASKAHLIGQIFFH